MSGTPLARYDLDEQCWKTSVAISLWALTMSSLTLPPWGCLHDGELYELPTPERPTIEPGYLSLPTPTGDDASNATRASGSFQSLTRSVVMLPTPAVNDMGAGKDPQAWDEWTQRMRQAHSNGNGHGKSLEQEALKMLPTPVASVSEPAPWKPGMDWWLQSRAGRNLEAIVTGNTPLLELTGVPTPPPSTAGNTSLDDQHQFQLFADENEIA
jgi:hypothetical protein